MNLAHPGGAVGLPKPCFPTTHSIDQIEQFKESYSTFEFRAFSLRPGGNPLWRSRCAGAGQRDCQKGFPSGNRAAQTQGPSLLQKGCPPGASAVTSAQRFCQGLASGPLGRSDASGTPRDPSGPLGPAPRIGARNLGMATKKKWGDPSANVMKSSRKVSYRGVGPPRTILSRGGLNCANASLLSNV